MEIPVFVNTAGLISLRFHQGQDYAAVARDFARTHDLKGGVQCPGATSPETFLDCVVDHLVYDMQLQAIGRELKTGVQGRYYPLADFFEGRIQQAPQTAQMFLSLVENLVGNDDVLMTAYTYLKVGAIGFTSIDMTPML